MPGLALIRNLLFRPVPLNVHEFREGFSISILVILFILQILVQTLIANPAAKHEIPFQFPFPLL